MARRSNNWRLASHGPIDIDAIALVWPRCTLLLIVVVFAMLPFFLLANLLQLHFPVGKLQLRLQVCHFAGRDHVEAKGKVGENPVKWQKISQYLCSKIWSNWVMWCNQLPVGLVRGTTNGFHPGGAHVMRQHIFTCSSNQLGNLFVMNLYYL